MSRRSILVRCLLLSCASCAAPLAAHGPLTLPPGVETAGETIYYGRTFPLTESASAPEFIYERRVTNREGLLEATHITRTAAGALALADHATSTEAYDLLDYALYFDQQGRAGRIEIDPHHVTLTYDGSSKTEPFQGPVVVGPTLVGYLFHRLEALRAGETFSVRFAVLDRRETFAFTLSSEAAPEGQTRVVMKPQNFLVSLAIAPVHFTFDTRTKKLLRIEGRVPPRRVRDGALYDFDARVEYEFITSSYR